MIGCNKRKIAGIGVLVIFIGVLATYCLWPKEEKQDTVLEVPGNNNRIRTTETKEVSLFHIEGLATAQRTSNWLTTFGFLLVMATLGYLAFKYKVMGALRRMKKYLERD